MSSKVSTSYQPASPRVLIFSLRNIFGKALFRCPHYEFEDIIREVDSAELIAPSLDPSKPRSSIATGLAYHAPVMLNPGLRRIIPKQRYDILFTICGYPQDLLMIEAAVDLKDACRTSVCLLDELWVTTIVKNRYFLNILAKFDLVMLYYSQTVQPLQARIGSICIYLPPGVDAISFCPYPDLPGRVIDVYSIGRRSEVTHQKLLTMVRENGLFYIYDSIGGNQSINSKEHRALLASIAKRSRYFMVNPGLIDQPEKRGNQIEIGNRYFEGAASGTIMIGERPKNEEFDRLFDWPEAVTELPYGSADIDTVIRNLDKDPERQLYIRRTNVVKALLRHDWVYRWEAVLKSVGLDSTKGVSQRKERLRKLAEFVSHDDALTEQPPSELFFHR